MTTQINNSFKSKVFKAAWTSLRNGKSKDLSTALRFAWAWAKETLSESKPNQEKNELKNCDVKQIYNLVYLSYRNGEYSEQAYEVFFAVRDKSKGFQSDIADKAIIGKELTMKQAWCIAFEFKKVA